MRGSSRGAPGLGALAGVLGANFLLEWVLPSRSPVATTLVSDLQAVGRPWAAAFRAGDVTSSVLLAVLAAWGLRTGDRGRRWRAGLLAVLASAAATAAAALVPETCTPVPGAAPCPFDAGAAAHEVARVLAVGGALAGALLLWLAERSRRPGEPSAVRRGRVHLATALLAAASGAVVLAGRYADLPHLLGWPQRVQILVLSAWCVAIGRSVAARDGEKHALRTIDARRAQEQDPVP
ncbi:hypothetical protein GCM10028814_31470 [Angustibacter aerolatus]